MQASASAPSGGGRGLLSRKKKKQSSPGGLPNQGSTQTQTQNQTSAEGGTQAQTRTQAAPGEIFPSRHLDVPALYDLQVTAANATETLENVRLLNHDDRLIIANTLRKKLEEFLETGDPPAALKAELKQRMETSPLKEELELLGRRGEECREAADDLAGYENWTFAAKMFNFETYIRPIGNQLYVKVEGSQEGTSIFAQLVVVREASMYNRWGPFVSSSTRLKKYTDLDLLVHFELNAPLLHRDSLMRAYACDYSEKDMILICGDAALPNDYPNEKLPPEPMGWLYKRLSITRFRTQVHIHGVNKGKVVMAALIDPNAPLPQSIINFAIKQIIGILLYLILRAARKLKEEGDKPGTLGYDYMEVIRRDPYYVKYCLPRILWYCEKNGWEYPGPANVGGDAALVAAAASAVQQVVEEDLSLVTTQLARGGVQMEEEILSDKKKKKHFLRRMFKHKKKHHKHIKVPEDDSAAATAAAAVEMEHQHQQCPIHDHVRSAGGHGAGGAGAGGGEGDGGVGEALSWTLPVVAFAYFFVRMTIAPIVRTFSGPVGEAIVLAVLLQQVLSLLLKKGMLEPAHIHSGLASWKYGEGAVDISHLAFAASLAFALLSMVAATLQTHDFTLKKGVAYDAYEHLSGTNIHMVNTALFLLVLVFLLRQPKIQEEVKKVWSLCFSR